MTAPPAQLEFRRFAAPREDRTALIQPPFSEVAATVAENVENRLRFRYDFQGSSYAELTERARAELLAAARRWTAAYRRVELASEDPKGLIFLAGHQPELFHPGVWFKNFALGAVARQHGAAAINLIVDSDTTKSNSLRVPGGSAADPRVQMLPFDRAEPQVPYEGRPIADCPMFEDFGRRVGQWIAPLVRHPLVEQYWPMVLERARIRQADCVDYQAANLGYSLAQARHQLEGRWGLETLEIPQSWVCAGESFCWLVAHLMAQLPRFHETYNQAVREYRRSHGIRNAAQPVPDLAQDGRWLELPLWVWTARDPRRRRVFACHTGRETVVSDRHGLEIRLPLKVDGDASAAVAQLMEQARRGVKIRSRALITTLWARLVLGDVFLHGIGGAKYDQVTDLLIERFFGLRAPEIMVLSATLLLPAERGRAAADQARAIRRELRDLTFHPEKVAGELPSPGSAGLDKVRELVAAKEHWIRTPQTPDNAHARWRAFSEINEALQPFVADRRHRLMELQSQTEHAQRSESILAWREYAFCLYPEGMLQKFLEDLLPKIA